MSEYHGFNVEAATKYGVACALLLEHIGYWVSKNQISGVNRYNGRCWMYKSVKDFSKAYPYLTEHQIRRALEKLRNEGLIVTGHFSKGECTRTLWYTLTRKGKTLLSGSDFHLASVPNGNGNSAETNRHESQNDTADAPDRLASVPNGNGNSAISSIDILETIVEPIVETVIEEGGGGSIDNPFGEAATAAAPVLDPLVAYAQNNLMHLGPYNMDELISFRDTLPDELIRHAIDEACAAGVRRYKYVKSILNRYVEQGFKSVAEVEAHEQERKKKGGTNGGEHRINSSAAPQRIAGETIV
jgi:DnaD/phage-associated family protein